MKTTVVTQGIIRTASTHSVDETVDQLKNILQSRGVSLFALIDHVRMVERTAYYADPIFLGELTVDGNSCAACRVSKPQ